MRSGIIHLIDVLLLSALIVAAGFAGHYVGYQRGVLDGKAEGFIAGVAMRPGYDADALGKIIEATP